MAAPLEPPQTEEHRRERDLEAPREPGRRPRALRPEEHVERVVVRRQLRLRERRFDHQLPAMSNDGVVWRFDPTS
jgi:hypothetical protein